MAIKREDLISFYSQHSPDQVQHVDQFLQHYSVAQILESCQGAFGCVPIISQNNGALTSLNLASNLLKAEGAKHVAEAIKRHVSALRFD